MENQDEFMQQLEQALNEVEQGYISTERMAIIRYACGVTQSPQKPVIFDFNEII